MEPTDRLDSLPKLHIIQIQFEDLIVMRGVNSLIHFFEKIYNAH